MNITIPANHINSNESNVVQTLHKNILLGKYSSFCTNTQSDATISKLFNTRFAIQFKLWYLELAVAVKGIFCASESDDDSSIVDLLS